MAMPINNETQLDVSREAIQRLFIDAVQQAAKAQLHSYPQAWWEGYVSAIEHILQMEHE